MPDPIVCTVDSDCPEGFVCVDGVCVEIDLEVPPVDPIDPNIPGGPIIPLDPRHPPQP